MKFFNIYKDSDAISGSYYIPINIDGNIVQYYCGGIEDYSYKLVLCKYRHGREEIMADWLDEDILNYKDIDRSHLHKIISVVFTEVEIK